MDQLRRELARDAAPLGDGTQMETDHTDVHAHGPRGEPAVVAAPVVPLDGFLEAIRNVDRLGAPRQIRNEEAELVATETRMQVA